MFVNRNGDFRSRRANVRRTVSFFRAGMQGELADHQQFGAYLLHGQIHHAAVVIENSESRDFSSEPFRLLSGIAFFNANEHEQSSADGSRFSLLNGNGSSGD